jgi:sugar O-acyltransferase (sialic acid O-acetyltransferase NeuD family)
MTREIIILGTGGNSVDILDTLNDINEVQRKTVYKCVGLLDDDERKWGQGILGAPVLGPLDTANKYADCVFANGIGSANNFWKKREIIASTQIPRERFETILHPTASISRTAHVGRGVVVFQNVTITSNVTIGDHAIILPSSVISHDDVIGDYTCIAGGVCISGNVTVGQSCYLGSNASVKDGVKIGAFSLVGMGSVVLRDVAENCVVVGNPARALRKTR